MRATGRSLPIAALLLFAAGAMAAQTTPLEITFGYRFLDVTGNRDEYRTQINEHEGLLLRSLTFATADFEGRVGFLDHFRVDASDLGVGPAGALRLEAGRTGAYSLRFYYRRAELFSSLADFANPFFPAIIPGQHTFDRVRNVYDAELELLPGRSISPILGYTRNTYAGPGRTTYTIGQNDFRLTSDLNDVDQEYRAGVAFDLGALSGRFLEGWRQFREDESLALAPGAGGGNETGTIIGVPVNLTSLNRTTSTKTDTPTTSAVVTGRLGPRIKIIGSYQRAHGEADTNESEVSAGSLVSFQISRLFAGLTETASTKSKATFWTGAGRTEVSVADGIDVSAGYSRRHRYFDGFALVSSLYVNSVTFAGQDPKNLLVLLQAQNAMDRTDGVFDVAVSARGLGPVALRAGWSQTRQDVTVTPDLSEIVLPGNQGGTFGRRIDSFNAGLNYSRSGLTLGADYQRERANDAIVRTDFLSRDRYRLRLSWTYGELLRVSANGTQTDSANDQPGIAYDGRLREYGGDLEISPAKPLRLRFSASKFQAHSTIPFLDPEELEIQTSEHSETGLSLEGGIGLTLGALKLDGSYARFTNKGSYPFTIDRARISGEVPIRSSLAFVAEWLRDKYNDVAQNMGNLGKFDANRYGLYLRWSP
jgi:hypothetical protein